MGMDINLGEWVKKPSEKHIEQKFVYWRESEQVNGHILLAGGSGVGKTHNIRRIISEFNKDSSHPLRIHILDVHDDIEIENESSIYFSESANVGLNPLKVDPSPHTGGVRKTIQNFISTINKTSRKLGDRQEAVLFALLEDLYSANGYKANDPSTWLNNNKKPNVDDLHRWINYKYKQMFTGGDTLTTSLLNTVNKEALKITRLQKTPFRSRDTSKLNELKAGAITAYSDYINSLGLTEKLSGQELDEVLRFDSKTTLKSVLDRISNLKNSGIFRNNEPHFDSSCPVWRYRLKALSSDEKKMFVHFKLKELYDNALKRGLSDHIIEVIVLDEANSFMDNDPDNIINIMANEIRKFGVSLICASQSFTHFTDDFLSSVGCKIVLGVDEMYWDKTARQLQIPKKWLDWITPRRSALIHLKRNAPPGDKSAKTKWFHTKL